MGLLSHDLATALCVNRDAHPALIAERALRQVGIHVASPEISAGAATWITSVVSHLGQHLQLNLIGGMPPGSIAERSEATAALMITSLKRQTAPQALAVMAPTAIVPAVEAGKLGAACRAMVGRLLPIFCERLLREWERAGHATYLHEGAPPTDRPDDEYDDAAARLGIDE